MKSVLIINPKKKSKASIVQIIGLLTAFFILTGLSSPSNAKDEKSAQTNKSKPAPAKARKQSSSSYSSQASSGSGLAREWTPSNELKQYKQNYLLPYARSSQPNNLPTSPNPRNQILVPYTLQDKDIKFQISLKHVLADFQQAGTLWLGYTQLAFWQAYDQSSTRPFREIIYEPELIYSFRPNELSIFNFGATHQSIGESNPRERSWNRVYVEPGIQFENGMGQRLIIQIRWWKIIQEPSLQDNPDISEYLGYRELNLRYVQDGGWKVNLVSRIRSTQLDIAAPLSVWFLQPAEHAEGNNANIHLQYFNGYGESLLDYNQSHVTTGIGLSFPL
jgi:phospholipase A1